MVRKNSYWLFLGVLVFLGGCADTEPLKGGSMDEALGYCSFLGDVTDAYYNKQQYEGCHGYNISRAITCCSIHGGTWIETSE